jgi:hypothetical protein
VYPSRAQTCRHGQAWLDRSVDVAPRTQNCEVSWRGGLGLVVVRFQDMDDSGGGWVGWGLVLGEWWRVSF